MTAVETADAAVAAADAALAAIDKAQKAADKVLEAATQDAAEALRDVLGGVAYKADSQVREEAQNALEAYDAAYDRVEALRTEWFAAHAECDVANDLWWQANKA